MKLQIPILNFQINLQTLILFFIAGVVVFVFFFAYIKAQSTANDQKRINDIEQIQAALKIYHDDNGFYPVSNNGVPKNIENYISFWPTAPNANGRCTDEQNTYSYSQRPGTDYWVTFCLGANYEDLAPGLHRASSKGIE